MGFLKLLPLLFLILVSLPAKTFASGEDMVVVDEKALAIEAHNKLLCNSTNEYIRALKFLRTNRDFILTENSSRLIAEKVSKGCNGAADRFSQVLMLLKTAGVSERRALELGLEFANRPADVQKNFVEIFTHAFLQEFFDYDYPTAARLAFELSIDYHGDPVEARNDFLELVRFCKEGKSLDLPTKMCADLTVRLARLSQYYPNGIRRPFFKLFKELREKREFSMNMKNALEVTFNVLKNGPRAPENFFSGYAFALSKDGLNLEHNLALAFGLKMANQSYLGKGPPPYFKLEPSKVNLETDSSLH